MIKIPESVKITIESHGVKVTSELPWDADLDSILNALKGQLFALGWEVELLNSRIKTKDEEI
jgi:hypothetical protein